MHGSHYYELRPLSGMKVFTFDDISPGMAASGLNLATGFQSNLDLGFGVLGLGFQSISRFRVWGLGLRVSVKSSFMPGCAVPVAKSRR